MRIDRWAVLAFALVAGPALAEPLIGPSVGNADLLTAEGNRLYNEKAYDKAAESFLKAARANPAAPAALLGLGRSYLGAKQLARACVAYRAYVKGATDTVERAKAQSELELCERQLKGARGQPKDPTPRYVEKKAAFFAALDAGSLLGSGSASEVLKALLKDGYVGVDLADMGGKLSAAANSAAEELHARALKKEKLSADALRSAKALYQLAVDTASPPQHAARAAFLEGLAELQAGKPKPAEVKFAEAAKADPSVTDYTFYRAIALHRAGDSSAALKLLEAELPRDVRTATLRAALAVNHSPEVGAAELEKLLFSRRYAAP